MSNLMDIETVTYNNETNTLDIIDQTLLPNTIKILQLSECEDIFQAIKLLKVRGAPAIGVAAAIGLYVVVSRYKGDNLSNFIAYFKKESAYLASARQTAVNLVWALNRLSNVVEDNKNSSVVNLLELIKTQAIKIHDEDIVVCRKIGEYGVKLIADGNGILTHCNAGKLGTIQYGTATSPIYIGHQNGYKLRVFADETRPLLQGARLTAFELKESGIDVTLLCDNMSASLMSTGAINIVYVGCDRVAANGDTANKIGTSMVAICAKRYNIPFYVCAPISTIDLNTLDGSEIEIEQREGYEVTDMWYVKPMAPTGVKVYNPAFDVTANDLISGFITEYGIIYPPFKENFVKLFEGITNA